MLIASLVLISTLSNAQDDPHTVGGENDLRMLWDIIENHRIFSSLTLDSLRMTSLEVLDLWWTSLGSAPDDRTNERAFRRPMFIDPRQTSSIDLMLRSTVHYRTSAASGGDPMSERSVLRWDERKDAPGGSFGEVSIRRGPDDMSSTSGTFQYESPEGSWEIALGQIQSRSTFPLLSSDRHIRLSSLTSERIFVPTSGLLRKPSFREETEIYSGAGAVVRISGSYHILSIVGQEANTEGGMKSGRFAILSDLDRSPSFGIDLKTSKKQNQVIGTLFSQYRSGNEWGVIAVSCRNGKAPRFLFQGGLRRPGSIRLQGTIWHRTLPSLQVVDEGAHASLSMRMGSGVILTMIGAQGSTRPSTGPQLSRGYAAATLMSQKKAARWMIRLRRSTEEKRRHETIFEERRSDLRLSIDKELAVWWDLRWRFDHAWGGGGSQTSHSSSSEVRIRYRGEDVRSTLWSCVFSAQPGLHIWSTQPGFLLWPSPAVYSGTGFRWGLSCMLQVTAGTRIAGYLSVLRKTFTSMSTAGILIEFRR